MPSLRVLRSAVATGVVSMALGHGLSSCSHAPSVLAPIECSEPCCGGDPTRVDCGNSPNLSCRADADPYSCEPPYGCVDGGFYPRVIPTCDAGSSNAGDAAGE